VSANVSEYTREHIEAMSARDLDALIAGHLMGWRVAPYLQQLGPRGFPPHKQHGGHATYICPIPAYSTDWRAMGTLMEHLRQQWQAAWLDAGERDEPTQWLIATTATGYRAQIIDWPPDDVVIYSARGDALPMAVARVAAFYACRVESDED
jgi:hypothetical protein